MSNKRKVAILGATGTVGQRYIQLLQGHPWFKAYYKSVKAVEKQMREAAKALEFEKAAELRDRLRRLRAREFGLK